METTDANHGNRAGILWLARAFAGSAALLAAAVWGLLTPDGRHYYNGLVTVWHMPIGWGATVLLASAVGLGCCVCTVAAIWGHYASLPPDRRDRVRLLEIAILLLAVAFTALTCVPPLIMPLVWRG